MAPNFARKNIIKHVFQRLSDRVDPYDEVYSVKAHFDEASSDISSTETLLAREERPHRHNGIFFAFNIAMFCLSASLFFVNGYRIMKPNDPFNNAVLRQTSEHCKNLTTLGIQ